jgi:hypothetical protein
MADRRSLLVGRTNLRFDARAVSLLIPGSFRAPLFRLLEFCDEQIHSAFEYDGEIAGRVGVPQ